MLICGTIWCWVAYIPFWIMNRLRGCAHMCIVMACSWDRQSYFWQEEADQGTTKVSVVPEMLTIQRNLILNKDYVYGSENSNWCIDHDDASSWYEDSENVLVYGAHKVIGWVVR